MKRLVAAVFMALVSACQTPQKLQEQETIECKKEFNKLEKTCQELYESYLLLLEVCVAEIPAQNEIKFH